MKWRIALFLSTATWSTGLAASADDGPSTSQRLELTFPVSVNGRLSGIDIGLGANLNVSENVAG